MLVNVTEDLRIECDGLNFTLQRRAITGPVDRLGRPSKNAGQERWTPEGHYPSLQQAAIASVRKGLCGDAVLEVQELIAVLQAVGNQVSAACHQAPSRLKRLVRPGDRARLDQMLQAAIADAPQI